MKRLLDQGLPISAAALLRDAGVDTLHVAEIGLIRLRAQALTNLLLTVIAECQDELEQGSAITVEPNRIRIRRLLLIPDVYHSNAADGQEILVVSSNLSAVAQSEHL